MFAAPPHASFNAPTVLQVGQTGTFESTAGDVDGDITATSWDFGDGATASGTSVTHAYDSPGTRTVTMTVVDAAMESSSTSRAVRVNAPPTAAFSAPATAMKGQAVSFDASASGDSDGDGITEYAWDFDDNGTFDAIAGAATASHAYATAGTKTVRLRVRDATGATGETTRQLRVLARPVAGIAYGVVPADLEAGQNSQIPIIGQRIGFASNSTDEDGSIASYSWADSAGFTSTQQAFVRPGYTSAGQKHMTLTVTDDDGLVSEPAAIATLRVNTRPSADFWTEPPTPVTNEAITFDADAVDPDAGELGQITRTEWDLDDDGAYGESGELGERVTATFATAGAKPVKLRVVDGGGARSQPFIKAVEVMSSRPSASLTTAPADPLPGTPVTFTSTSGPSAAGLQITKVEWDFDYDRRTFTPDAVGATASHAYPTAGTRTVAVRVTETGDGFDIATGTVRVNAPPQASFTAAPTTPVAGDTVTFSSTSADPDGPIQQEWDTDGDGQFDDATGAVAARVFAQTGTFRVALRVTDDRGARAISTGEVRIAPRPLRLLDAAVRIAGRTTRDGADITLLRVRAPAGAKAVVKCKGKGKNCPAKRRQAKVLKDQPVRFKRFERNLERGAKLVVKVTQSGFVGRHVALKVRLGKAPKRRDRCLPLEGGKPISCTGR